MLIYLLILVALILVNGLFAMAELSLFSSRGTRLKQLAKEGSRGARAALRLLDDPTRFLSTVQFYITLIGILAGVYSGARFAVPLAAWLGGFDALIPVAEYLDTAAYGVVVVGVTFLSLIFGELVPKRWALTNPEAMASRLAPLMEALAIVSKPFVWVLQGSTELVSRVLGIRTTTNRAVSEEEIRSMIAEATHTGIFHVAEHQMIEGVLRLPDRTVRSIMVPRGDVVWLDAGRRSRDRVERRAHQRPLALPGLPRPARRAGGRRDDRRSRRVARQPRRPASCRPACTRRSIVHESTRILRLLELFRESKVHFAVIVDEHGSIEGVVTPSDILTAIAGELPEAANEEPVEAVARDDSSWLIDGGMSIDDVERLLKAGNMRSGDDYTTLAGFVLAQLGHLPATGESFRWRGLRFEVVDLDGRRIDKLLVQRLAQA